MNAADNLAKRRKDRIVTDAHRCVRFTVEYAILKISPLASRVFVRRASFPDRLDILARPRAKILKNTLHREEESVIQTLQRCSVSQKNTEYSDDAKSSTAKRWKGGLLVSLPSSESFSKFATLYFSIYVYVKQSIDNETALTYNWTRYILQ